MEIVQRTWFRFCVAVGILLPMFFTLNGGIYRTTVTEADSGGRIGTVPLPVSILVCGLVLALLIGRIRESKPALAMVIGTGVALALSVLFGGDGITPPMRKLIMTAQVMLPLLGLLVGGVLGQCDGRAIARGFLVVLSVIVPAEFLMAQLLPQVHPGYGPLLLADYLYFFSIYAYIEYANIIFVCAFAFALGHLWDDHRRWLAIGMAVGTIFAAVSRSYLCMGAFAFTLLGFAFGRASEKRANIRMLLVLLLAGLVTVTAVLTLSGSRSEIIATGAQSVKDKFDILLEGKIPPNVEERFGDWRLFGSRVVETPKTLLVGHPEPMPREIKTSPHNWYLDIAHTFGLVGLLPIMVLIAYTVRQVWRHRKSISPSTWWLAGIVLFLVVIDSNFKVTLRQPYPGIFAFFMWGLLLSRLAMLNRKAAE